MAGVKRETLDMTMVVLEIELWGEMFYCANLIGSKKTLV